MADDVLDLWRNQKTEGFQMTTEEIHKRVIAFEKTDRRRMFDVYLACACIVIVMAAFFLTFPNALQRTGAVLIMVSFGWLAVQARRTRTKKAPAEELGNTASLDFLRAELSRRRDVLRSPRPLFNALIFTPGYLLFFAGFAASNPKHVPFFYFQLVTFAVVILLIVPLNRRVAGRYERELAELEKLG